MVICGYGVLKCGRKLVLWIEYKPVMVLIPRQLYLLPMQPHKDDKQKPITVAEANSGVTINENEMETMQAR